ncbi:sugar phosphate isomerase/epimerase [bacterium]|nr:sugar phosphate isomerase/epimerase [bacterium]
MNPIELHLGHFIDNFLDPTKAKQLLDEYNLRVSIMDGGWLDLAHCELSRVREQVEIAKVFGIDVIRLFFPAYSTKILGEDCIRNIYTSLDALTHDFPDTTFLFETHHGIGVEVDYIFSIMLNASSNMGLVFDPVNLAIANKGLKYALNLLGQFVKHVHLKGATVIHQKEEVCYMPFGEGNIDVKHIIPSLCKYTQSFGLEYEGSSNAILGLVKSRENLIAFCKLHNIQVEEA